MATRERITPQGESLICKMFNVTDQNRVSKEELKITVLKQIDKISKQQNLIKSLAEFLFRENANHPFFETVGDDALLNLRKSRF